MVQDSKRIQEFKKILTGNLVGIVVKTQEELGSTAYGVYIPRLMMGVITSDGPTETKIDLKTTKCLNSKNKNIGKDKLIASNYIVLTMDRLYNISMPFLIKGETVNISVIDKDIKSLRILPYTRDQTRNRPVDMVELYAPASGNYNGDILTEENTYYVRVNSVDGNISIHTSNSNGEISKYDIRVDAANGTIKISDEKRQIVLSTEDDQIYLRTEGGSVVELRESNINVTCENYTINASESMTIKSPKVNITIDEVEVDISNKLSGKISKIDLSGDKVVYDYSKIEGKSDKIDITSPKYLLDGRMYISKELCPKSGIVFKTDAGKIPLPINPNIDGDGKANFAGPAGIPLVKGTQLSQILSTMAMQIDMAGAAYPSIMVGSSATIMPMLQTINSQTAKG